MKKRAKFYATAMCDGRRGIKKGDKFPISKIESSPYGRSFHIENIGFCLENECAFLNNGNWLITEE